MPVLGHVSSTLLAAGVRIDEIKVTMNTTGLFFCILLLLPACFAQTDIESDLAEKMDQKLEEVASLNAADVIQDIREALGHSGSGSGSGETFMDEINDDEDFMV